MKSSQILQMQNKTKAILYYRKKRQLRFMKCAEINICLFNFANCNPVSNFFAKFYLKI